MKQVSFAVGFPRHLFAKSILLAVFPLLLLQGPFCGSAQAGDFESGMSAYHQKEYLTAVKFFRSAVLEQPDNAYLRYYLADSLLKANRIAEAQTEYNKILASAPDTQAGRLSRQALVDIKTLAFNRKSAWQMKGSLAESSGGILSGGPDKLVGISASGGDYLDEVLDAGKHVRWSLSKVLNIYVDKTPKDISHFQPGFISTVPQAIAVWSQALGGQLHYAMVNSADQADIVVTWVNSIDEHGFTKGNTIAFTAGLTTPLVEGDKLQGMRVRVATLDIQKKPQDQDGIYRTVIHELGHALGIMGHSDQRQDVMYFQNQDVSTLSNRDINTIRKLYLSDADVSNATGFSAAGKKPKSAEDEARINDALDKSVAKYEEMVKQVPSALSYINLGVNYSRKADSLPKASAGDTKSPTSSTYWNNKAVDSYTKALSLEPENIWALTHRATVYQTTKDYDKALVDITHAIKISPRDADMHLQQAQILYAMGRKPEATNALNNFKQYSPNAAASPSAKSLEKKLGSS